MCGRYWIDEDNRLMKQVIEILNRSHSDVKTSGEICPGDAAPVICKSRSGNIRPFVMEWGFMSGDGRRVINARSETAAEKPMFRESMLFRRCVLPMNAYFEWEKQGNAKKKHWIFPENKGIFCLAGLYRFENDRPKFTVLTMDAADEIAFIHPRMPLILPWNQSEHWLNGHEPAWQLKMKFE